MTFKPHIAAAIATYAAMPKEQRESEIKRMEGAMKKLQSQIAAARRAQHVAGRK